MANSNSNANVSTMCVHLKAKLSNFNCPAAIQLDDYQFNAILNSKHLLFWPNTDTSELFQ